jgi:hypothetical protein
MLYQGSISCVLHGSFVVRRVEYSCIQFESLLHSLPDYMGRQWPGIGSYNERLVSCGQWTYDSGFCVWASLTMTSVTASISVINIVGHCSTVNPRASAAPCILVRSSLVLDTTCAIVFSKLWSFSAAAALAIAVLWSKMSVDCWTEFPSLRVRSQKSDER